MGAFLLSTIVVAVKDKAVGMQLKKARIDKGLSQEEAGSMIGVTWEMISRYENGRTNPLRHLTELAEIYGKPMSYFIRSENEPDTFDLDSLADKLREKGVGYTANLRNVVKIVNEFTGRGIEKDLDNATEFYEVSSSLTQAHPKLFALRAGNIKLAKGISINPGSVCLFALEAIPEKGDITLNYNGINYSIAEYSTKSNAVALAVLIEIHQNLKKASLP